MSRRVSKSEVESATVGEKSPRGRARWRKYLIGGTTATLGAAALVGVVQGTAEAVTPPHYCGTAGSGNAGYSSTTGSHTQTGTQFTKSSGCSDFNLVEATAGGFGLSESLFEGQYEGSNGTWHVGSRGFVGPVPFNTGGDWVLLSSVATGTKMIAFAGSSPAHVYVNY
jgi:hypothetical protein